MCTKGGLGQPNVSCKFIKVSSFQVCPCVHVNTHVHVHVDVYMHAIPVSFDPQRVSLPSSDLSPAAQHGGVRCRRLE